MKAWGKIIPVLLFRELWPAGDGKGIRQMISYRFFVSLLPPIGVFLMLVIVSFAGLCLEAAHQSVDQHLSELKTSPYMALFGEGFLYSSNQKSKGWRHNFWELNRWKNIKLREVQALSEMPTGIKDVRLFEGVFPFSWIYLEIRNKNNEHLPDYMGMGLIFSGEDKDKLLIEEIEKNLEGHCCLPDERGEGIIISRKGLEDLKWEKGKNPPFLWVRFSKAKEEVPVRVLGVAERLPYQFKYIMSIKQLNLLKNMYYYDRVKQFEIGFPDGYTDSIGNEIREKLPPESIIDGAFRKGEVDAIRINLPQPWSRVKIIKEFLVPKYKKQKLWLAGADSGFNGVGYDGAIFHMNSQLLNPGAYNDDLLLKIEGFLEKKEIKIKSGLVHALQIIIHDQESLSKLGNLSQWGMVAIVLFLVIFFSVILHIRVHRIGIIRMLGVPDILLLIIYFLEGVFFTLAAFSFSAIIFYLMKPLGFGLSLWSINILKLIGLITLFTELGFLLPAIHILRVLQPAEMMTYRA